ncbi:hypothetical protein HMPREF0201_01945 [Cedecea davisae DSM 4568]|uniref:Uncharacterized protein n=1 Tax=Cedecea davisae DSM 4568 TaxID=566551 RepID=S3IV39_9ENTR|nr:hypothetical protein HMPREF0201_01945 [Cedecea davisae DSM 4568]
METSIISYKSLKHDNWKLSCSGIYAGASIIPMGIIRQER